jgi:hypothetical protein
VILCDFFCLFMGENMSEEHEQKKRRTNGYNNLGDGFEVGA